MTGVEKVNLGDLPNVHPLDGCTMRRLGGEQAMLQVATMPKGAQFEPHSHVNEQIVLMLEGRLRLDVGTPPEAVELAEGDMLVIPPNVLHGGEALSDCRVLDAFSPPRTTVLGEEEPEA
jgi:quercetin dioxygenase-like cupin family protein